MEIWKDVKGFEEKYQVSSIGNVRRKARWEKWGTKGKKFLPEKPLKIYRKQYLMINISGNGRHYWRKIHRIVAEVFIPNPENKPYVNHKDGNKRNNHVDNLSWVTASENTKHAADTGLMTHHIKNFFQKGKIAHNRKLVLDLSNGIFYDKISEAAYSKNLFTSTLTSSLNGRRLNKTSFITC